MLKLKSIIKKLNNKEGKKMRKILSISVVLALALALGLMMSSDLSARGTTSGTVLQNDTLNAYYSNSFSAQYSNSLAQPVTNLVLPAYDMNTISVVQRKFTNSIGAQQIWSLGIVTNYGNLSDDIRITVETQSYNGPGWIPVQFEIGVNGAFGPQFPNFTFLPVFGLPVNTSFTLQVRMTIPVTVSNGSTNMFRVSINDTAGTGPGLGDGWPTTYSTVFGVSNDLANDRDYQEFYLTIVVEGPVLLISKTVDVTNVRPYDMMTYTIHFTNAGNEDALGLRIQDSIPANTVLITNSAEDFNNLLVAASISYETNTNGAFIANDYSTIVSNTNITMIQWIVSPVDTVAGGSGDLVFKVLVK